MASHRCGRECECPCHRLVVATARIGLRHLVFPCSQAGTLLPGAALARDRQLRRGQQHERQRKGRQAGLSLAERARFLFAIECQPGELPGRPAIDAAQHQLPHMVSAQVGFDRPERVLAVVARDLDVLQQPRCGAEAPAHRIQRGHFGEPLEQGRRTPSELRAIDLDAAPRGTPTMPPHRSIEADLALEPGPRFVAIGVRRTARRLQEFE